MSRGLCSPGGGLFLSYTSAGNNPAEMLRDLSLVGANFPVSSKPLASSQVFPRADWGISEEKCFGQD